MLICASTECFPGASPQEALSKLVDLEYTAVELAIHEQDGWMRPSVVAEDFENAIHICRQNHRLDIAALSLRIDATGAEFYRIFESCCKLAKGLKVATLVVPSGELGTPFNEEIEHLKEMVRLASLEGAVVCLKTEIGCMTQDPDTAAVLCDHVKGLKLCLDPSHYIAGPANLSEFDKLVPHVQHVHLRDSKPGALQVCIGQGDVDYGKLIQQLSDVKFDRALSVHIAPTEEYEHEVEMRKLRLLLESSL